MKNQIQTKSITSEPLHYKYRSFFVGLFVLIPAVLIPAMLVFTLAKVDWMEDWCYLYTTYNQATGLNKGASVTIAGQTIGYVDNKGLSENDGIPQIDITLKIRRKYTHFIKKNSIALLHQKNFPVGDWEIALTPGSSDFPPINDGDTIKSSMEIDLGEVVKDIQDVIKTTKNLLVGISNGEGSIGKLITDDTLVYMAQGLIKNVNSLTKSAEKTIKKSNVLITSINKAGDKGNILIDSLFTVVENSNATITDLNKFIKNLDTTLVNIENLPKEAEDLMTTLDKAGKEADNVLKSLKYHWLLRRSIKKLEKEQNNKNR